MTTPHRELRVRVMTAKDSLADAYFALRADNLDEAVGSMMTALSLMAALVADIRLERSAKHAGGSVSKEPQAGGQL